MAGLLINLEESGLGDEDSSDEIFEPDVNHYRRSVMRRDAREMEQELPTLRVEEISGTSKTMMKRFNLLQIPTASRNTDEEPIPINELSRTGEISKRMKRGKRFSLDNHNNYENYGNASALVDTINKLATRIDTLDHQLKKGQFRLCDHLCCHEHLKGGSGSVSCINIHELAGDCEPSEIQPANQGTSEKFKRAVDMKPRKTKPDAKIVESYELLPTEEPHSLDEQKTHASNNEKLARKPQNFDENQPAKNMNLVDVPKQLDIREVLNRKDSSTEGNSSPQFIRIDSLGLKSANTDPQEDNRQKRIKEDVKNKISAQINIKEHSSTNHSREANLKKTEHFQSKGNTTCSNKQKKGLTHSSNIVKTDDKPITDGNLVKTERSEEMNRNKIGGGIISGPAVSGASKTLTQANASSIVLTHLPKEYWDSVGQETYDKAKEILKSRSIGFDTIICLDTSASVAEYWGDILDFLRNFINEIETVQPMERGLMEHIALVTFGHETSVLQHFTTKYQEVLTHIHTIYPEGSTPMYWAVNLCQAILLGSAYAPRLRGFKFSPRLLLITDGRPTYRLLTGGLDESEKYDEDMEKEDIARRLISISMQIPLLRVYTVAVGNNYDKEFLTAMANSGGGKVMTLSDWSAMAQYGKKMELASKYFGIASLSQDLLDNVLRVSSGLPKEDIEFVTTEVKEQLEYQKDEGTTSDEGEVHGSYKLPPVGSRVRRGPDWNRNDEDNAGPGTITAYSKGQAFSGWIIVEWDKPKKYGRWRFRYRYGAENAYDVKIQEHERPRVMENPLIMRIGCEVIRVSTPKSCDDGIEEGTLGIVYNTNMGGENAVRVRWKNGKQWMYDNEALLSGVIELSPRSSPLHEMLPFDPSQFLRNLRPSISQRGTEVSGGQPLRQEALPPYRGHKSTRELKNPSSDRDFMANREALTIENVERSGMPSVDDMNIRNKIRARNKEKASYEQEEVIMISDTQTAPNAASSSDNAKRGNMKRTNKNADV